MCALYVGNLHPDCNEATLYQKFAIFGKLQNVHICRDFLTRQSLGYGFVNFFLRSEAETALSRINYDAIFGKPIRVMWIKNSKDKEFNVSANLFVKNIHPDIDEKILHDIFSSYGDILSLKIAKRDVEGNQEVAGYVQFKDEESADSAIEGLNGKLIHGQVISVAKYRLKKTKEERHFNNIYLKNFGSKLKDEDLIEMCRKFGSILSAKVMTNETGESKGFGFVSFKDPDSAKEAVENLNGFILGDKKLFTGRAKKKGERQAEVKIALLKKIRNCLPQTT